MSTPRTITGNLDADVEVVEAGSIDITKFRVIENTGEYRGGKYVEHPDPTTHFVEAKFELGEAFGHARPLRRPAKWSFLA